MQEEQISHTKVQGQCDTCGKFSWVTREVIGTSVVSEQCRKCYKQATNKECDDND